MDRLVFHSSSLSNSNCSAFNRQSSTWELLFSGHINMIGSNQRDVGHLSGESEMLIAVRPVGPGLKTYQVLLPQPLLQFLQVWLQGNGGREARAKSLATSLLSQLG